MAGTVKSKIEMILKDGTRGTEAKIRDLLTLRSDARALQRAATESPMDGEDPSSDLQQIDLALEKLGHGEVLKAADEDSAATL
ncbi:hypothetical protein [Roseibium litorale]|uniref:Uncharacterized protein n=1 Tax=Roseibium litorale TaxID=2803841 RepID=A0ABR9CPU9_9HYPH|nr:hypothetical protein [Roseibium litorale]MBD8892861.1 hypothetical protein [Roseibium litorale]